MPNFNQFSYLPQVPYKIIESLFNNENIWKILKYPTYDCLSEDNLTLAEKSKLIWRGQDRQEDFSIFLTPLVENAIPQSKTIMKIYKLDSTPVNHIKSTVCYEIDILYGGKTGLINWNGMPCNRADVLETELMQSLNGAEVNGVGVLQFNRMLSKLCNSHIGLSNNMTYTGVSIVFAVQMASVE